MHCRMEELRNKQVVCVRDGKVLGYVSDVQVDTENGALSALVIFGRPKILGILGKCEDLVIPWREIEVIGQETILVSTDPTNYLKNIS